MTGQLSQIEQTLGIDYTASRLQPVRHSAFNGHNGAIHVKRDDLLHPVISGNKWRKLKYLLQDAMQRNQAHLVSMGGAWSNHLHALAYIGHQLNIKTTGLIRGETSWYESPTLQDMRDWGMQLEFVDREQFRQLRQYKRWDSAPGQRYGGYWIPEGGATPLALKGIAEMKQEIATPFDTLVVACGSGTTLAGLIPTASEPYRALGIAALKGAGFLDKEIHALFETRQKAATENWSLNHDYHHGGFAKSGPELQAFIEQFETETGIPLEPVYTGKVMLGIFDLIRRGAIGPNEITVVIHSGGLQGKRATGD